jgi:type II secretory pathway component GspD/PulD (secretin)
MTGIGLGCITLALLAGQAEQQPPEADGHRQQFIAAEPVLRARPDSPKGAPRAEARAELQVQPRLQAKPKVVRPRLMAAPAPVAVARKQLPDRKAIRIKYAPAGDVAAAIEQLLQQESGPHTGDGQAAVVADPTSNTLLVSALPARMEQIESLVTTLDRKPAMIRVDAALVQVTGKGAADRGQLDLLSRTWKDGVDAALQELRRRGEIRVLARPTLMVVDNQAAFVQVGRREPRLTGVRESPQGRTNQMELENVGMILGVTARANDDDRITMEIDLEDSRLGAKEQGALVATMSDGEQVRSPGVDVTTAQTTVCVVNGQAVIAGSSLEQRDDRRSEFWMIVAARFVEDAK